jgi:hypothetical protein
MDDMQSGHLDLKGFNCTPLSTSDMACVLAEKDKVFATRFEITTARAPKKAMTLFELEKRIFDLSLSPITPRTALGMPLTRRGGRTANRPPDAGAGKWRMADAYNRQAIPSLSQREIGETPMRTATHRLPVRQIMNDYMWLSGVAIRRRRCAAWRPRRL